MLNFAGGFTDQAYIRQIKVYQVNDQQRSITDIKQDSYKTYIPQRGDKYIVEKILNRFTNRVAINGAVFRPGNYELENGLTLSRLIDKAAGLKEDAFTGQASITRLNADNSKRIISVSLKGILDKTAADVALQREDSVHVSSIFDLRNEYAVAIKGEVRNPGSYAYADSITVTELIIKAGGFTEGASSKRIEVSRRKISTTLSPTEEIAVVYNVDVDPNLNFINAAFTLKPYDIISVYSTPGYEKQRTVQVEGEVQYPGLYTIRARDEKISDIIIRAGNLKPLADAGGSSLKRTNVAILGANKNSIDSNVLIADRAANLRHLERSFKDTTLLNAGQARNNYIGINLAEILKKPGSITDLIVEDGDVIRVPKRQQVVSVNGEVLFPSAVVFEPGKDFKEYILSAGGYAPEALKKRAYIVYANGAVRGTKKILFFRNYPKVKPGSEIFVPRKPAPKLNTIQNTVALTTGLASLGAIILGILSLRR
jgi:protein involved in polysaccharide export with SLBB domain